MMHLAWQIHFLAFWDRIIELDVVEFSAGATILLSSSDLEPCID